LTSSSESAPARVVEAGSFTGGRICLARRNYLSTLASFVREGRVVNHAVEEAGRQIVLETFDTRIRVMNPFVADQAVSRGVFAHSSPSLDTNSLKSGDAFV
jgi:hypothetical protein